MNCFWCCCVVILERISEERSRSTKAEFLATKFHSKHVF